MILDLGGGTGRITHALIRLGDRVTAVDFEWARPAPGSPSPTRLTAGPI